MRWIEIVLSERDFEYEIQALVVSFFPGVKSRVVIAGETQDSTQIQDEFVVGVELSQTKITVFRRFQGEYESKEQFVSGQQDFHKKEGKKAHPYRSAYKNVMKGLLFDLLRETPRDLLPPDTAFVIPPWGTMTGVRPTKIPMSSLLAGKTPQEVGESLGKEYRCRADKKELCLEIALREASLLQKAEYDTGYSLYVGIPFCPTTCTYCSFPSYPLERFSELVPAYLTALEKEIRVCGKRLQGQRLTSVYVGGGTPTTLSPQQLDEFFSVLRESFNLSEALEITVEAGRPDSITKEKLLALKRAGVDRISVNPQTMQEDTLRRIGRKHSVAQVREVFLMARECGFDNINMDLIVGLPEETVEDFADTLRQVELLDPDSITIHSLVIKRASKLREILDAEAAMPEKERAVEMEKMMELGRTFAKKHGYAPYYMYRQKNSAGYAGSTGQENIGFAREGKECLYNILIMEEMQSILAVGAGASTKCYDRQSQLVSRVENVKSVTDYINRIDEMLERKRVSQWKQII